MRNEIEYLLFPERGVVVAKLKDCGYDFQDKHPALSRVLPYPHGLLSEDFTGVAQCKAPDIFNEETGKRLAAEKAWVKYRFAICRKHQQVQDRLTKLLFENYKKSDVATQKLKRANDRLQKMQE